MSWYLRQGNHLDFMRTHLLSEMSRELWPVPSGSRSHDLSSLQGGHPSCLRTVSKISSPMWLSTHWQTNTTPRVEGWMLSLRCGPKCTACKRQEEAVSFCQTCNSYLCEQCLTSHQNLSVMFEAHEIVSVQDIINGKVSISHLSEKCFIHKQENKDMFCEDCKVHVCLKCVIVGHQFHKIKNQADFEQELRLKVNVVSLKVP